MEPVTVTDPAADRNVLDYDNGRHAVFLRFGTDIVAYPHGTEFRPAHGAEMRYLICSQKNPHA
jgi:hypothetical protein